MTSVRKYRLGGCPSSSSSSSYSSSSPWRQWVTTTATETTTLLKLTQRRRLLGQFFQTTTATTTTTRMDNKLLQSLWWRKERGLVGNTATTTTNTKWVGLSSTSFFSKMQQKQQQQYSHSAQQHWPTIHSRQKQRPILLPPIQCHPASARVIGMSYHQYNRPLIRLQTAATRQTEAWFGGAGGAGQRWLSTSVKDPSYVVPGNLSSPSSSSNNSQSAENRLFTRGDSRENASSSTGGGNNHNHNHNGQTKSENHNNNNEFVQNWMRLRDRFLYIPVGLLKQHYWAEGETLLKDLRNPKSQLVVAAAAGGEGRAARDRMEDAFRIMDRMNQEVKHYHNRVSMNNTDQRSHIPAVRLPLEYRTLAAVLLTWRDYNLTAFGGGGGDDDDDGAADHENSDAIQLELSSSPSSSLLASANLQLPATTPSTSSFSSSQPFLVVAPSIVFQKVQDYEQEGLFEPGNAAYNIILHVLAKTVGSAVTTEMDRSRRPPPPQVSTDALSLAQRIFEHMTTARGRQQSPLCHPDEQTICHMIDLWIQSGRSEAHIQADQYLARLQEWYQQQKQRETEAAAAPGTLGNHRPRNNLRPPSPQVFCAVMEAHCKFNQPTQAYRRIMELFAQMKESVQAWALSNQNHANSNSSINNYSEQYLNGWDTGIAYNRTCLALANARHPQNENVHAARAILDEMCESSLLSGKEKDSTTALEHNSNQNTALNAAIIVPAPKVSTHTFLAVLTAYGRAGLVQEAQQLFDDMEQFAETMEDPTLRPNIQCYSALIWAHAKVRNSAQTEAVFLRMLKAFEDGDGGIDPKQFSPKIWNGVLASWAGSNDPNAAQNIFKIMERLRLLTSKQDGGETKMNALFNVYTYNVLLSCYARQQQDPVAGAKEAEKLLEWMEQQDSTLKPTGASYFNVIKAWANAGVPERCQFFIRKLYESIVKGKLGADELKVDHFNVVIQAWAKSSSRPDALDKTRSIFQKMKQLQIRPDSVTYNSYLWALARLSKDNSKHKNDGKIAMDLFRELKQKWKDGDAFAKPDAITCNAVLTALSLSDDPAAMDNAAIIFEEMREMGIARNVQIYTTLMSAYAKRHEPIRAEELFQEVQTLHQEGDESMKPTDFLHRTRLNAWSKAGNPERTAAALGEWLRDSDKIVGDKPNTVDFTSVLSAWVKSGREDAHVKAERGLDQMIELAQAGRFDCFPNIISFSTVMSVYIKSKHIPNPGEKAAELFEKFQSLAEANPQIRAGDESQLRLYATMCNMLMSAWIAQRKPRRADDVFYQVKREMGGTIGPGESFLFATRLHGWLKASHAKMATAVLEDWIATARKHSGRGPATRQFNSTMWTFAASSTFPDCGERAERMLRQMYELAATTAGGFECYPDALTYEAVISAYAQQSAGSSSPDDTNAFGQKILSLLNEMRGQPEKSATTTNKNNTTPIMTPTVRTYANAIAVLARSHDANLHLVIRQILHELQTKHASFWTETSTTSPPRKSLETIRTALLESSIPAKFEVLSEYDKLVGFVNAAAAAAAASSNKQY